MHSFIFKKPNSELVWFPLWDTTGGVKAANTKFIILNMLVAHTQRPNHYREHQQESSAATAVPGTNNV